MPVEAACPSCDGKFRLPDAAAGKKIRCPKCKGPLDVPPLGAEPAAVSDVVAQPQSVAVANAAPAIAPPTPAAPTAVVKPTTASSAPATKITAPASPVFNAPPAEGLKSTWRTASQEPAPPDQPRAEAPTKSSPTTKPTSPPAKPTAPVFVPPAPAELSPPAAKAKPKPPEPVKPTPPAVAPELWFLKGEDGETYGPVDRPTLNGWHDEGRMTADSQLLKHGTEQWQWASDLYPDLEEPETEEAPEPPPAATSIQPAEEKEGSKARKAKSSRVTSKEEDEEDDEEDAELSPHSKPVAVLLGLTLGWLGIHRFYLGYVGMGLAMFFTLGGLLIWSTTDALRILFGHVTDSEGKKLRD